MRIRYHFLCMALLLGCYLAVLTPFVNYMGHKPYLEKLGVIPRPEVLKVLAADQKELVAATVISKVILYFGELMGKNESTKVVIPADYPAMSRTIHAALKLDPYNMDGYYFAQAILVWDVKQYKVANELLEYGMKYRTWDWYLPFFAGFNYAYFLKDYPMAAKMYMRAGELSRNPLFESLAGRYMQQSGRTEMAIAYLNMMAKGASNPGVRKTFEVRLRAFKEVLAIEKARDRFKAERGRLPGSVEELETAGYLSRHPVDPYGGVFYLEPDGSVATTSKFAEAGVKGAKKKEQ
jgi:tetratricopeptide (TPR) repeat protein